MTEIQTDLAILGAGPAGYVCAIRAADLGKKVTIIEAGPYGGTCLNVGCIPSKALISAGHFVESVHNASAMGFTVAEPELDLEKLVAWKDTIVGRLTGGIGALLKSRGIETVQGRGKLTSANTIEVTPLGDDGSAANTTITARDIVLATGSEPAPIPGFEFGEKVWSSTEALSPKQLPKSLFIIGGGSIGRSVKDGFVPLMKKKMPNDYQFNYVEIPDEGHSFVPYKAFYEGLISVFSDYPMPFEKINKGMESIKKYFSELSRKYDYKIKVSEWAYMNLINNLNGKDKHTEAMEVAKQYQSDYPQSSWGILFIGRTYEHMGNYIKAKEKYEQAIFVEKSKPEPDSERIISFTYRLNLLQDKLNKDE